MIRTINFSDPAAVTRHDCMALLVERMLTLHKQLPESLSTPHEKTALASGLIEAMDGQIDAVVYRLYGLTEEEIEIVENADKR